MASFVAVLLVLSLGHRWSVTAFWFTSDKTCGERRVCRTPWYRWRPLAPRAAMEALWRRPICALT